MCFYVCVKLGDWLCKESQIVSCLSTSVVLDLINIVSEGQLLGFR